MDIEFKGIAMIERFSGTGNLRKLKEALLHQRIVQFNEPLADSVIASGRLVSYAAGKALTLQGDASNDVYFILAGEVEVVVNGRRVARRSANDSIGEMALLSPSSVRSASVISTVDTVVLHISESEFARIAEQNPTIWKPIAAVVADRLREREQFHKKPNETPTLFIGSSAEGIAVVNEVVSGLKHDRVLVRPWTMPGVFSPGGVTVDVLLHEVEASDFAVFVFGPDDKVVSRNVENMAPRDNVIFELGLFMGLLGRNRTYLVHEQGVQIKIPTDILGVTPITYVQKPGQTLSASIVSVCHDLRMAIQRLGVK